jgi:hypothetical protein
VKDHVVNTTKNFTKQHGQIICNKGAQAQEVFELLLVHGYKAEDVCPKKAKAIIKYDKK